MNLRKSKTSKVVAGLIGFSMVLSLFVGVGVQTASAQGASLKDLVELFISLGIIAPDKAVQARAAVAGTPTTTGSGYQFNANLSMGANSEDVRYLQQVLNANAGTQVSASGAGSPGQETTYFGGLTKTAVIKFQIQNGISPAAGFVGPLTRAKLNSMGGGVVTPPVITPPVITPPGVINGSVSAMLDSSSPAQGVVIVGQSIADLGHFKLMNNTSSEVKVTALAFNRIGVSNDSALSNVYVYNGINRLTDSATVSQGKITFNDASGIVMIPAGGSVVISVRSDIASGTSGQLVGVALASVTSNAASIDGAFPISAAVQSIATATLGTVDFTGSTVPSTNTSVDPQTDYVMWQKSVTVNTHDVWLKSFRLRQIGSVAPGDLGNFKLFVDGTQVGGAVALLDANSYVTFDLSAAPVKITTGSHTIKMIGDIIGGTNRTFSFSLRQASDINVVDTQLNVNELATVTSSSFSAITTGDQSVTTGTLTITKDITSPTGNVTLQSSSVVLGRFLFKAAGEPIKVENLLINTLINSGASTTVTIRNGALYANNAQIGSTQDIGATAGVTTGTTFNLGSSLVVNPGTPIILEVRGDVYDSTGGQDLINGTTVTAQVVAGSSNAQRLKSLSYSSSPSSSVSANILIVAQGTLSVSKYAAYANQQAVKPQTAFKIGEYTVSTNSTEPINLNTLTVDFNGSGASSVEVPTSLQNVYLVYGGKTTSIKTSVASTSNSYNVNQTLTAGQSIDVAIYSDITSSAGTNNVFSTTLDVAGQTSLSNQSVSATDIQGQTVTVKAGSISISRDASTPVSDLVVAGNGNTVKLASFKIFANNDTYTVTDLAFAVSASAGAAIQNFTLKDQASGVTLASNAAFTGANSATSTATTTGLSLAIPANTSKIVDVWATLSAVGTPGYATTSVDVRATLAGLKANGSTGSQETNYTGYTGNAIYTVKTRPVLTNVTLPSTVLAAGTQTVSKVSIAADAAGAVAWAKLIYTFSKTSVPLITYSTLALYDESGTQIAGTFSTTTVSGSNGNATAGTIIFTPSTEQQISGSKTYSLKLAITGAIVAGESFSTSIASSSLLPVAGADSAAVAATAATFVWSDLSSSPHSTGSADWLNDTYVKNIPTDAQTMSK